MKTLVKAIAIASLASTAAVAQAEVSVDAGMATSYMYRGVELDSGAIASASANYTTGGFAAGIAVTSGDLDAGGVTETDYSLAYTANLGGQDITLSYTNLTYDQQGSNLDDMEQEEIALSTSISGVGISYTQVTGETDAGNTTDDDDFDVITLDYSIGNVNVLVGMVGSDGNDADYNYFEISNSTDVAGVTLSASYIGTFSEDDNAAASNGTSNTLVFGVSKGFDL